MPRTESPKKHVLQALHFGAVEPECSKSGHQIENTYPLQCILYTASNKRLGVHKMRRCLDREYGIKISAGRIYRLMKGMALPKMSTATPAYKPAEKTDESSCVNHVKQNFKTDKPNLVWVSDITYIKVSGRFYYICVIIDIFSRKVIAWELGSKIDTDLVIRTLQKACQVRKPTKDLIFHSDRGCQYTSSKFRKLLDDLGIVQSFSAKGYPYDNAVSESFSNTLRKRNCIDTLILLLRI